MKIRMSMTTSIITSLLPGEGSIPNAVRIGKTASMYRRKHTCIWLSARADVSSQPGQHRNPSQQAHFSQCRVERTHYTDGRLGVEQAETS
eukprot:COSAG02_NODE_41105_length_398_cov_0.695652_1_plen_89_part_10